MTASPIGLLPSRIILITKHGLYESFGAWRLNDQPRHVWDGMGCLGYDLIAAGELMGQVVDRVIHVLLILGAAGDQDNVFICFPFPLPTLVLVLGLG
jgi:hypothetical protein